MNNSPRLFGLAFTASTMLGLTLAGCGMMDPKDLLDGEHTSPSMLHDDTGSYNMSCGGRGGSSYAKQAPFKQSAQNSSCKPSQKFEFPQKKVADYDVDLDCSGRRVVVHNRGADQKQQELPIQSNGKVQGKLQYQQAVQNDGKGNQQCWVKYDVDFNGKAECGGSAQTPSYPGVRARQNDRLMLETRVSFKKADLSELRSSGFADSHGPGQNPDQDPDQNPGQQPGQNPGQNPDQNPDQNPGQNPGQHPSPTPTHTHPGGQHPPIDQNPPTGQHPHPYPNPMPTQKPIVVCDVEDSCPMVGSTDMSCGDY
jgi:hypothetical protein